MEELELMAVLGQTDLDRLLPDSGQENRRRFRRILHMKAGRNVDRDAVVLGPPIIEEHRELSLRGGEGRGVPALKEGGVKDQALSRSLSVSRHADVIAQASGLRSAGVRIKMDRGDLGRAHPRPDLIHKSL